MISGATIFLYLLPLAAAPVVFHLLMRRQRKRILFSTKMFFDRIHPQLTIHRKLREWLLLAARTLLIALLLLGLAQLVVTGAGSALGLGGKQVAVVVLDNSGSMAGRVQGSEKTKLETAVVGARALLGNMEDGAQAGIVPLVTDLEAGQWGGITSERDLLLDSLNEARVTQAAGDPAAAMRQAIALLKEASSAGGGSIHVFTDLQATEWQAPQTLSEGPGKNVHVFFHRVPTAQTDLPNVCLVQAALPPQRILPGQPYPVELLLRNQGDEDIEIRVNMQTQDQTTPKTTKVVLAAGASERVRLGFRAESPGYHWIRVWIEGDGFRADNRASLSCICEPTGDIYFAGGQGAADFGVLPLAFSPSGDGRDTSLAPRFGGLASLEERIRSKSPLLVVLTWSDACALDTKTAELLETYTRQGGNLLILPTVAGPQPSGKPPAWLGADVENLTVLPEAAPLVVRDGTSEFWSDLRGPGGRVRFRGGLVKQYYPLSLKDDAQYQPLLGVGEDRVALAVRRLGDGQVTVSGMAFAARREGVPEWSTLPMQRHFLVLVRPMALGAVSGGVRNHLSLVAGNAPRSLPAKEDELTITTLVGGQVDWSGPRDRVPTLVREGAYVVRMGTHETFLSVMPSDTEGGTAFLAGSAVPAMGKMPHEVRDLSDEQDFRDELQSASVGIELYMPLLLLAIAAFVAEGLLASPSLRRKRQPTDSKEHEGHPTPKPAAADSSREEVLS